MPELPEVQTTVEGLRRTALGVQITDVWTDRASDSFSRPSFSDTIKNKTFFDYFKKEIIGTTITSVHRRAKHILITLSNQKTIIIHMKMTGHILHGSYMYSAEKNNWTPSPTEKNDALRDPFNRHIHVVWSLSSGKQLALCDARVFATVRLVPTETIETLFSSLGPEPLSDMFSFETYLSCISKKPRLPIKQVLLDQTIISGIGNIYSDEALWEASLHPLTKVAALSLSSHKALYKAIRKVLHNGISFGGDSTSDYRNIDGVPGTFHGTHHAYKKANTPCSKKGCKGIITRTTLHGRGLYFCPTHQI